MRPEMLMSGSLEPTNSAYATAKLAGIELCQAFRKEHVNNFITVIPANVFGPGDDFSIDNSHVVASLIRRMDDAIKSGSKSVNVWGSGKPKREFIFVNDLADACIFLMKHYEENSPINVGTGTTLSVRKLAYLIMDIVGYNGKIEFDTRKPDGMPIKVLDSDRLFELGWIPSTTIHSALDKTYHWFKSVQSP
jgi:GDP-L-fucose synthase